MNDGRIPDGPEAVALMLMALIDVAEEKAGRRDRRSNMSEHDRLLTLYKECLDVVNGAERTPILH